MNCSNFLKEKYLSMPFPGCMIALSAAPEYKILFANNDLVKLLGYKTEKEFKESNNCCALSYIHQDTLISWLKMTQSHFKLNDEFSISYQIQRKDKSYIWVLEKSKIIEENGDIIFLSFLIDITIHKKEFDDDSHTIKDMGYAIDVTYMKYLESCYNKEITYRQALKSPNLIVSVMANLSKNNIEEFCIQNSEAQCNYTNCTFTESLKHIAFSIPDKEHRSEFLNLFNIENLVKCYDLDEKTIFFEYKRIFSHNKHLWVSTTAKLLKNPVTADIMCFFYTYNINEEKILKQVVQNVVSLDYDFLMCLNGNNDSYLLFPNSNGTSMPSKTCNTYEKDMESFINTFCINGEKEETISNLKLDNIFKNLEVSDTYIVYFSMKDSNGIIKQKKIRCSYINKKRKVVLLTRTDITDIIQKEKNQNEILKSALRSANQASLAKNEFLSRMSHEMRTPMNAIIGLSNLAIQSIDNPTEVLDLLSKLKISANFLLDLINDILDMRKIESGKTILSRQVIDLPKFIHDINIICDAQAKENGIKYSSTFPYLGNRYYIGDEIKLKQIFINLISNAIKFTPEGGEVNFNISIKHISQDKITFVFVVKDNGIGISKEFIPYLFEPFSQENNAFTSKYEGTGLGLAICKKLINLMKGKINVNSIKGHGTEFIVEINMKPSLESIYNIGNSPKNYTSYNLLKNGLEFKFQGKKILLVEDHPLNIEIAKKILESRNMIIEVATDGLRATEIFTSKGDNYFDAILMDIRMPIMDGFQSTKIIRGMGNEYAKNIPIIAMTANDFNDDIDNAKCAGMNAHLTKPIESDILFHTLNILIV